MSFSLLNPADPSAESKTSNNQSAAYWSIMRAALANGRHVLAHGPAGTGKTHALMYDALGGRRVLRIQCQEGATTYDILGQTGIAEGSTRFERGPAVVAVENGWRVIFDEIDRGSEDLMSMIYAFGDGKPFTLPDGSTVTPDPRFQMCATTNADPYDILAEGPRDRFCIVPIHEPNPAALVKLPEPMRESARRAVRHRVTGLRAWYRFAELLADVGMSADDALAMVDQDGSPRVQGLILPAEEAREALFATVARVAFGEHQGDEILRAWRVAAAREGITVDAARTEAFDIAKANYDAGYAAGIEEGEHDHDSSECEDCVAIYDAGYERGVEVGEENACHSHDIGSCSDCEALYDEGYASAEHDHDADDCSACERIYEEGKREGHEEGHEEGHACALTCEHCGADLALVAHACTVVMVGLDEQ